MKKPRYKGKGFFHFVNSKYPNKCCIWCVFV